MIEACLNKIVLLPELGMRKICRSQKLGTGKQGFPREDRKGKEGFTAEDRVAKTDTTLEVAAGKSCPKPNLDRSNSAGCSVVTSKNSAIPSKSAPVQSTEPRNADR